jgi:hypothetical protein
MENLKEKYTVILFSAILAEIRLKMVECAQLNFHHRFWSNVVGFGRNSTLGWFFVRRFGRNSIGLKTFRPKMVVEFKLRAFDRF